VEPIWSTLAHPGADSAWAGEVSPSIAPPTTTAAPTMLPILLNMLLPQWFCDVFVAGVESQSVM
jgi:hypothetical protein